MGHHLSWTCRPPQKGWPALPQLEPLPPLQLLGSPHNSSMVEKPQEVEVLPGETQLPPEGGAGTGLARPSSCVQSRAFLSKRACRI